MALISAKNISKDYAVGDVVVQALQNVTFDIAPASFVAFIGPSGSGKSTILNLIGCLDKPSAGTLTVADTDVAALDRKESAAFRGRHLGFIFQDFNLIPVLTVYENIEYPLIMVQNVPEAERRERICRVLEAVDMADQADKYPQQISGGQKQRVAVARALVTNPALVLADEPTANLDSQTAYAVINLMKRMRDERQTTFIFSTHDQKIVGEVEVLYRLVDGRLDNGPETNEKPKGGPAHA
ncbi:MAG: ABC transporter ATP-binding protein [Deltaproteobacteria bacterium]|nr:ABC transporter ATP-binding protein [Deltaproteobacteria bacterium]